MSCDAFVGRFDALLDGSLARFEHDEIVRHLEECADCRDLCAALAAGREDAEDPQLSERILARTSGAACGSAVSRLCAWSDGELDAVDADLVAGHLRHCSECAGLARTLAQLQVELPRLASVDPGPAFLENVLARTSRRARREPLGARFGARFGVLVVQLFDRPRIALEGAFVAMAILVAPVLVPGSPFADVPGRALDIVREPPPRSRLLIGQVRGTLDDLESTLASGASAAWKATHARVVEDATAAAVNVKRNCASTWETIRNRVGTLRGPAASSQQGAGKTRTTATPQPPRRT